MRSIFYAVRVSTGKKHLVLGGTGQLGICLIRYLLNIGYGVRTIVRNPDAFYSSGLEEEVEVITGDLDDVWSFRPLVEGSAAVYFCATKWVTKPQDAITEMRWAENVALACLEFGVRLLYPTCVWAYGIPKENPVTEAHFLSAGSPYGTAKASAEHSVMKYSRTGGLKATAFRVPAMWGPFTRCPVTLGLISAVSRGRPFAIHGGGDASVEWIDPRDVARAMVGAVENEISYGKTYNLPGSGAIKWQEFGAWITKIAATGSKVVSAPKGLLGKAFGLGPLEQSLSWWYKNSIIMDGSAAERDLNFSHTYSLKQSIIDNWKWYANRRPDDPFGLR